MKEVKFRYNCFHKFKRKNISLVISKDLPMPDSKKIFMEEYNINKEDISSIFLHSANYKFSFGSGSSGIIRMAIDDENKTKGKSQLEKEILKIRKTPVCGVKITSGIKRVPEQLLSNQNLDSPWFDWIIHAVIPGLKSNDFETRLKNMIIDIFKSIRILIKDKKHIDLCIPVIGVNNFNYPIELIEKLYYENIIKLINETKIEGRIWIWNDRYFDRLIKYFTDKRE